MARGPQKESKTLKERERGERRKIPGLAHILMTREDTTHADYNSIDEPTQVDSKREAID